MIKTGDDYSEPELIEFNENKVLHFGVRNGSYNGVLSKNQIWTENISDTRFELVNANRIRFFRHGKLHKVISETESITVDEIFKVDYERLEPTKTDLSKMDIEKLEFNVQWNKEHIKFVFNKDLDSAAIQEVNKRLRREGRKLSLENLDGTYFGAIYDNGVRETLIPIREISKEKLTLYGFPEKPYEITVH